MERKGATTEKVLQHIVQHFLDTGEGMTIREVAEGMHMGCSTAHWHVQRLVQQCLIHAYGLIPIGLRCSYEDPRVTAAREAQFEMDRQKEEAWYAQTDTFEDDDE